MLLDLVVLVVAVLAAWSGWRVGGIRTAVGVLTRGLGLAAGLAVANLVAVTDWSFGWRVAAEVGVVLLGLVVGGRLARAVAPGPATPSAPDKVAGAVLRGAAALVVTTGVLALVAQPWGPAGAAQAAGAAVTDLRGTLPGDLAGVVPALGGAAPPAAAGLTDAEVAATVQVLASTTGASTTSTGSGFVVTGGRVVTAHHVVAGARAVTGVAGGADLPATVVVDDAGADVAVLQVTGLDVTPVTVAAGHLATGSAAVVAGYPGGGPLTAGTATVVGGVALPAASSDGIALRPAYRLQADVRPGNSGGPLFDGAGAVVGMVDARSLTESGVGFALTTEPVLAALARAT